MKFSYVNPTQIHFGQGQIATIASAIPQDQKVLVIYGGGSIKKNGVYDQVTRALKDHTWTEFSGVESNPTENMLAMVGIFLLVNIQSLKQFLLVPF